MKSLTKSIIQAFTFLFLFNIQSFGSIQNVNFIYISDIDDTIKITNVQNGPNAAYNGVFSRKAFSGMPTLFRQIYKSKNTSGIEYLSGSGDYLKHSINSFLIRNEFPSGSIFLKKNIFESVFDHKINSLKKIIQTLTPNEKLIFIGDDTQKDPFIYQEIQKLYPDLVEAIYIHKVTGKRIPSDQIPFTTAFDIAINEFNNDRLEYESAISIGMTVLLEKKSEKIIPQFMNCDSNSVSLPSKEPSIEIISKKIEFKILKICESRLFFNSDIQ